MDLSGVRTIVTISKIIEQVGNVFLYSFDAFSHCSLFIIELVAVEREEEEDR